MYFNNKKKEKKRKMEIKKKEKKEEKNGPTTFSFFFFLIWCEVNKLNFYFWENKTDFNQFHFLEIPRFLQNQP